MDNLKVFPDVVTYNTLINGCLECGSSSKAFGLIQEMEGKGVKPDSITHNILVKWYIKHEKMDDAGNTIRKMGESGFSPNSVTYNTLINGYCKAGKLGEALRMMDELGRKGLKMDGTNVNTILHALCKEGRFEKAFDLLEGMKEKKLGPDCHTYNAILGALADACRFEEAEKFVKKIVEMEQLQDHALTLDVGENVSSRSRQESDPNSIALSEQINELCAHGKYKDAMQIFQESSQNGSTLNKSAYINLMEGLIKRRKSISKTLIWFFTVPSWSRRMVFFCVFPCVLCLTLLKMS
ncbi:hypothetical protein JCGZ_06672 [Jatropha curcas]|uniref:Pentacotripeptide-repeat region of PRORP domain-containing protein n=1 Tax=Jatropha curcas TaxID=180498 RepID=A0A067LCF2_JATCU|nr:hypothetical protein JCGZ_06672 [Jatropha curcas]